ncbi:putative bifunctional diguanylate cyclase/phosphodiesterase [Deinococcus aestuarii]|uniref:putative bifunctional diguanylate cyclase/phosphodiesterase n=1 Tax=Deinococcus aestuarii TaxID=2774531 RepID=UPI001C0CC022|nr:EAL domain-containing protein [Deinococcus aestuarii]
MLPFDILSILAVACLRTGIAVCVALRAWQDRPARLYVVLAALMLFNDALILLRLGMRPEDSYALEISSMLWLCGMATTSFLLYSSLFVPQWWVGRRPIRLIAAPYLVCSALLALDLLVGRGWAVALVPDANGMYDAEPVTRLGQVLVLAFALRWFVELGVLGTAFWRQREDRVIIGALILAAVAGFAVWLALSVSGQFAHPLIALLPSLPQHLILAYLAVRTRLFEPTRVALDLALHAMSEAVAVLDRQGKVVYANPSAQHLGLLTERSFAANLLAAGLPPQDVAGLVEGTGRSRQMILLRQRRLHVGLTPVQGGRGRTRGTLFLGRDVTELEQRNAELSHLAGHDALTGLPNRRSLGEALERTVLRARQGQPGVLMFIDLDQFKLVNDTLGHAAGDELLVEIAGLLRGELRGDHLIARLGGDEFAVLLEGRDLDGGQVVAQQLLGAISRYEFTRQGRSFRVGFSLGLTVVDGQRGAQDLLAQADVAMYHAKARGGRRVVIFEPEQHDVLQVEETRNWSVRLQEALRADGLELHYQPVVNLADRQVEHHEALLRLRDEDGGLVLPGQFLPAAERYGLLPDLDRWVIARGIQTLAEHPGLRLHLNLSGTSLGDEELPTFIEAELTRAGVEPTRLGFEITETEAIRDLERARGWAERVGALGCPLALDDFGVGFTSFAYLRALPVDAVKIDGSFVRDLEHDEVSREIVGAITRLARAMGKRVVAEWVENEGVAEWARRLGVHLGQGYGLGRPGPGLPCAPDEDASTRKNSEVAQTTGA